LSEVLQGRCRPWTNPDRRRWYATLQSGTTTRADEGPLKIRARISRVRNQRQRSSTDKIKAVTKNGEGENRRNQCRSCAPDGSEVSMNGMATEIDLTWDVERRARRAGLPGSKAVRRKGPKREKKKTQARAQESASGTERKSQSVPIGQNHRAGDGRHQNRLSLRAYRGRDTTSCCDFRRNGCRKGARPEARGEKSRTRATISLVRCDEKSTRDYREKKATSCVPRMEGWNFRGLEG